VGLALLVPAAGCEDGGPRGRRLPGGWRLIQKQEYQALYAPSGQLARVLQDSDGDGVAEAIIYYRTDGRPGDSELDTDDDGVVDRWETLRRDGTVAESASSRRGTGRPDMWEYADEKGRIYQTRFDDDGDGVADRTEIPERPLPPPSDPGGP
jgi:hypothetical protein